MCFSVQKSKRKGGYRAHGLKAGAQIGKGKMKDGGITKLLVRKELEVEGLAKRWGGLMCTENWRMPVPTNWNQGVELRRFWGKDLESKKSELVAGGSQILNPEGQGLKI